jgi:phosphoenolpyruvate carboxylase
MPEDRSLRQEIRWLGAELGHVLEHLAGKDCPGHGGIDPATRSSQTPRQTRHDSGAHDTRLEQMSVSELRTIVRAFTLFLDLANVAEDRQRVRVLRERTRQSHPGPRHESIGEAVAQLRSSGVKPAQLASLLNRLDIELVLTAHPTEAKRRSVRTKLRTLRYLLRELDERELLPKEADQLRESIRAEITKLWQTDFIRPWRPTVLQEVQRGLSFRRTLWQVVPEVMQDLRTALSESYPDGPLEAPSFLRFGSWVGGDRDGHPYVKADITAETLPGASGIRLGVTFGKLSSPP